MAAPSPAARRPRLALAAVVLTAFVLLAGLSQLVTSPRSLADEVRYMIAAGSLAEGGGLQLRDEEYGFGPVYPTILAAILAVAPDRETAYPFVKVANALLFALAAVPVYLVARRLLPSRWSLGVAGLSLAIPTSVSVSLVMTESAAYPAACLAILAIVLALERMSVRRQLAVLGAVLLAFLTRAQFAVLFPAYLGALVVLWAVVPAQRPRDRRALRTYWPTLAVVALGVVLVVVVPLFSGRAPVGLPSAYDELWDDYDPVEVGRLVVYHLAGLEIYLAVIPFAVSPIVLWRLLRGARAGSVESGAFASAFLAVNACLVLVAAAFASTAAGFGHLHDRYLFYVVPLWLIVLAVWLRDGLPRPAVAAALGAALALALPALTPFRLIAGEEGQEAGAAVTYLWSAINASAFESLPDVISGRRVLALFVVSLVAAMLLAPKRLRVGLGAAVAAVLVAATAVAWRDSARTAEDFEAVLPDDRTWVDEAVATGTDVTSLYVSAKCDPASWTANALLLTEFFNRAVTSAAHVEDRDPSLLPSTDVDVSADGAIVGESGAPLDADAVLAAPGVELEGRKLATGTTLPIVLWQTDGPVRLARARSAAELQRDLCAAS